MWCITQLLSSIFFFGFILHNVHTAGVQDVDEVPDFSSDLSEILNLFNVMVKETSVNSELSSVIPTCSVQPSDVVDKPSNLSTQRICVISKEELDEIWNTLQNEESSEVASIIVTSLNCTELEKLKIGILKLKSSFMEIMKYQASSAKYEELKVGYEEKSRNFQKKVDDFKQTASDVEAEKIVKLQEELQKQRDLIKNYFKKIEEYQNSVNEAFVGLVVAEIDKKQIDSALQVFNVKITKKSQIRRIVSSVNNGTVATFNKILAFLRGLKDSEAILLGYTSLYDEIKSKNEMNGLNVLLISLEVFKKRNDVNFQGLVESLTDTLKELHDNNEFDSFYQFAKDKDNDFIKNILSIYVQVGFDGNIANTQKMLDLMPKFDKLIHKIYLLQNLISELKVTGSGGEYIPEMLIMVHNVIQLRRSLSKETDQFTRHAIIELENNIPEVLRDLMFQNLCIQNSHDGSYLYAGNTTDENGRLALTSNSSENYEKALSWQIEFTDNGNKVLFKNEKYNEYLYVIEAEHRREARLWRSDNLKDDLKAQFTIELQNIYWNAFGICSPKYNQYLEMLEVSDETLKVRVTALSHYEEFEHLLVPKQIWIIKSCRIPV